MFRRGECRTSDWKFPLAISSNDTVGNLIIDRQYTYKYYNNYIRLINASMEIRNNQSQWKSIL